LIADGFEEDPEEVVGETVEVVRVGEDDEKGVMAAGF